MASLGSSVAHSLQRLCSLAMLLQLASQTAIGWELSTAGVQIPREHPKPVCVIYDTDISPDCDDTAALAMLHALANVGEVELLAVMVSARDEFAAVCADAINTYFPVTIHSPQRAYELVLAHAGCLPRDRVSKRTIEEVKAGAGKWGRDAPSELTDEWYLKGLSPGEPKRDSDNDGIPDDWERRHGLNPSNPRDANKIVPKGASPNDRHAGYTHVEYYINELADNFILEAMRQGGVRPELPGAAAPF